MKLILHRACCLAYVGLSAELLLVARMPAGTRGMATVLLHAGLTLLMLAVWRLGSRHRVAGTAWVWGAALAARAVVFFVPSFLSNDIDRYLWDGAVVLEGFDPYLVAAGDPGLAALRDVWLTPAEHLQYPTLYPPLALSLFALCAGAGPALAPWLWKVLVLAGSLCVLWTTHALCRRIDRRDAFPLVALSPLLLIEGQVGAHLDVLVAAATALGLWALYVGHERITAVGWGLGAALKLLPAGPIGVWLVARGVHRSLGLAILAGAAFLLPYGLAVVLGWAPVGSLSVFFEKWRFASPLWLGLEGTVGEAMPYVALAGAGISAATALWLARRSQDASLLVLAMAIPLVWSPVVFPWYLVPLVPLLVVTRSVFLLGWLSTIPLTYEILDRFDVDASWEPRAWPVVVLAAAWGLGLAFDLRSGAKSGAPIPGPAGSTP